MTPNWNLLTCYTKLMFHFWLEAGHHYCCGAEWLSLLCIPQGTLLSSQCANAFLKFSALWLIFPYKEHSEIIAMYTQNWPPRYNLLHILIAVSARPLLCALPSWGMADTCNFHWKESIILKILSFLIIKVPMTSLCKIVTTKYSVSCYIMQNSNHYIFC